MFSDLLFVNDAGFHYPDYNTVLGRLQDDFRAIFGADVVLDADTQEGQLLASMARSIHDTMLVLADVYAFSPLDAQGDKLSRLVKINGLARMVPSSSTVDVTIVGQVGTTITDGQVEDDNGNRWALPASVVIPSGGEITVTATAAVAGAIEAGAGTVTTIATPTRGWQTVTNATAAVAGNPVESDAALRQRQAISTMIPALSVFEGIVGAVAAVDGVQRYRGYENDTASTDSDGIPAHSIAMVVEGGDALEIGEAIFSKKTAGTGTHGTTTQEVVDAYGITSEIDFYRPTDATIGVEVTLTAADGYLSANEPQIKQAIADHLNALPIGEDIYLGRIYTPANLGNIGVGASYYITQIRIKKNAGSFGTADLVLAFNEVAVCDPDTDVTLIVS